MGSMTDAHKLRETHYRTHTSGWYPQVRALQYIAAAILWEGFCDQDGRSMSL